MNIAAKIALEELLKVVVHVLWNLENARRRDQGLPSLDDVMRAAAADGAAAVKKAANRVAAEVAEAARNGAAAALHAATNGAWVDLKNAIILAALIAEARRVAGTPPAKPTRRRPTRRGKPRARR